jgi:hypothetical protein
VGRGKEGKVEKKGREAGAVLVLGDGVELIWD